jgi:spore coat protein CotH
VFTILLREGVFTVRVAIDDFSSFAQARQVHARLVISEDWVAAVSVLRKERLGHKPSLAIALWFFAFLLVDGWPQAARTEDAAARFYNPDWVQVIRLDIARADLDRMHLALPQRISVPATFHWEGQTIRDVGIRYKGGSSSDPESPYKRSFLIEFSRYKAGQRFLGLRHVALDNAIQFGSLFSERLITDILRTEGVKASRCNYARVYVNGEPQGVFVNVERIDRSFLERNFQSAKGALFKVDHGGPGADLRYVGADPVLYHEAFELHSGDETTSYAALVQFISSLDQPVPVLRQEFEIDSFIKTAAVLLLSGAFDQYTGWGPHNYYLYQDPSDRRWSYIPWDLDVGFADWPFDRVPVLQGWNAAWPVPIPGRPLMERVVSDPNLLEQYRRQARRILETWFRPDVLIPKLRALYAQIQPALEEDPFPKGRATVPSDSGIEDTLASMEAFMRSRYALARAQLDAPGDRPAPVPMRPVKDNGGPKPGPPSADAPTGLRAVQISRTSVMLQWVDNAEGETASVVQRCTGAECTDFGNVIGRNGAKVTTATDHHVEPGKTYRYRVYTVFPSAEGLRGSGVSNVLTVRIPEEK